MTPLAKSPEQGGLTLLEHAEHVAACAAVMAGALGFDARLARLGAVLHDLGKAHPFFQRTVRGEVDDHERMTSVPHRHEVSSLLFLPLFDEPDWPVLIDMVAAHHKSAANDARRRGLVDLALERLGPNATFARHAEGWDTWAPHVARVVEAFGVPFRPVPLAEARRAFDAAVRRCDEKPYGWSPWRGLLMTADHFASEFTHDAERLARSFYRAPDLAFYARRSPLHPLSLLPADAPEPHTFVVAPTGAGKTDYLLRRCRGRVVYTLPFQASINAMFARLDGDLNGPPGARVPAEARTDVRRVHAASSVSVRTEEGRRVEEERFLQRSPGASVKVTTPHQIAPILFRTSGHEAAALDVRGCDVILDEVHVYGGVARAMTLELIEALVGLGCRVHVGSATVPAALAERIVAALGGASVVHEVRLPDAVLGTFDRHAVHTLPDEDAARREVTAAIGRGERVLFVANRVRAAQERYGWARDAFPGVPVLLVHSRFRRGDRAALETQIGRYDRLDGPCVVVATQVVEVSLDVSFHTLVTDAAPLDALVQRFGRVHRRRTERTLGTTRPVYVIAPPDDDADLLPYEPAVVRRSFALLPVSGGVLHETALQGLVDAAYGDAAVPPITAHTEPLRELCHRPKSALLDALEIDGATVVRASDRDAYVRSRGEARLMLEIPVPWRSVARHAGAWPRLDVGAWPLVVPDELYSSDLGLVLDAAAPAPPADVPLAARLL